MEGRRRRMEDEDERCRWKKKMMKMKLEDGIFRRNLTMEFGIWNTEYGRWRRKVKMEEHTSSEQGAR